MLNITVVLVTTNLLGDIDGMFILSILQTVKDGIIIFIEILLCLLGLFFMVRLLILLSRNTEEIIILPFEVISSKKEYSGKLIADYLIAELRKIPETFETCYTASLPIKHGYLNKSSKENGFIYQKDALKSENFSFPGLKSVTDNFDYKINDLGGINVAGINVSMISILAVLRELWPIGKGAITIKGYMHEDDSEIHLTVFLESPNHHVWNIHSKLEKTENLDIFRELSKDLAYMIIYDLLKDKQVNIPETWVSLKYIIEAFDSYFNYLTYQKLEYLENSRKSCLKVLQEDKDPLGFSALFYGIGMEYYYKTYYDCSADLLRHRINFKHDDVDSFIGLGLSLMGLGQKEEALEAFERAIIIDPSNKEAWYYGKAYYFEELHQYEKALEAIEVVLNIDNKYAPAWRSKGMILHRLKQYDDALIAYENSVKSDSSDPETWVFKGIHHLTRKQDEAALESFNKSLDLNPTAEAFYYKGIAISGIDTEDLKSRNNAMEAFRKATLIDPNFPEPWHMMGLLFFENHQYENALLMYKTALKMYPSPDDINHKDILIITEYKEVLYKIALCYSALNYINDALKCLRHAVELDPSFKEIAKNDTAFEKLWADKEFKEIVTVSQDI